MEKVLNNTINTDVTCESGPINHNGRLVINGSVLAKSSIITSGDIVVRGRIENARVESTGGGVYVDKGIMGKDTLVKAFGDIKAPFIRDAEVESFGSAYINDIIYQAKVRVKNIISMKDGDGIIEASKVIAGMEMSVKSIGAINSEEEPTELILENFRQKELFEISLIYEQKIKQKTNRINELEKVIKVIQILGSRVATLSPEKKHELALQVKEYNDLKIQIDEILKERQRVLTEKEQVNSLFRSIIATSEVFPGVLVRIDNVKVNVNRKYKNVIFYKSGIVIIGNLDSFMKRKRMMQ